MDLSKEQKKEFIEFINKRWTLQVCPVCKATQWLIPDNIYEMPEIRFSPSVPRKMKMTPLIQVVCGNCGYTILFNAILTGIYKEDTKAPDETGRSIPAKNNAGTK
jgi:predicted nucleic-acid-binding Zn-ribbon protein